MKNGKETTYKTRQFFIFWPFYLLERIFKETSRDRKKYCRSYSKNKKTSSVIASLEARDYLRNVLGGRVKAVYSLFYLKEIFFCSNG